MTQTEHPQDRQILAYLKAPESQEFNRLRLHLAACRECRQQALISDRLRRQGHVLVSEKLEIDPRIADLVQGGMNAAEATELRNEIKRDPAALRAALHYASHAAAMGQFPRQPRQPASERASLLDLFVDFLGFRAPLWKTVPLVALLMMVMTVFLTGDFPSGFDRKRIIAFQDKGTIQFAANESQAGIGFFSQADVNSVPFAGMEIDQVADNRLRFSWPELDDVTGYRLKLQAFRDGETHVLGRTTVSTPTAEIELDGPLTQHRYEWVLSGDTSDNRSFQTSGGFVIAAD